MRQRLKKLSLLLDIGEPEEISPGVFQTTLSHPKLQGALTFVHSELTGRDEVLKALDQNVVGHLVDVIDAVGDLLNGTEQRNHAATPTVSSARERR